MALTRTPRRTRAGAARRPGAGTAVAAVAARRGYRVLFVLLAAAITLGYTLLLPFAYTQRITLANWGYLTGQMIAFALALGLGLAALLTLQVYGVRRVYAARRAAGGTAAGLLGAVASLLPSLLCCTPLLPTVLATVGLSGMTLFSVTGSLQYFFAVHDTAFLAGSLALLIAMGWWSARRIARATCLQGACPTPETT